MGSLRSKYNHKGLVVEGIELGEPPILTESLTAPETIAEAYFIWDDSRIPTGEILQDGTIVPDAIMI